MIHPRRYAKINGYNLIGVFDHKGGLGNAARGNLKALRQLVSPRKTINFPTIKNRDPRKLDVAYVANYLHFNPDSVSLPALKQCGWFHGKNIGYWAWETTRAPDSWLAWDKHMTQIWVPSTFVKRVLVKQGFQTPIFVIPHAVTIPDSLPTPGTRKVVNFLVTFDGKSRIERKLPHLSIAAIQLAAKKAKQKCHIIIKCHDAGDVKPLLHRANLVSRDSGAWTTMSVIDGWMDERSFDAVWGMADVLVSLNRGEGFGLPMVEAMARGVLVVATNWGGATDYLTEHNSFPVEPCAIVPCSKSNDEYFKTGNWAEPSLDHAVEQIVKCIDEIRDSDIQPARVRRAYTTAFNFGDKMLLLRMQEALQQLK